MIRSYVRPPAIEGVREASGADHVRALLWMVRGFAYEWQQSGPSVYLAALLVGWLPSLVFTIPIVVLRPWDRRSRYYSTPTAIIGVSATRRGDEWVLADHSCARPGSGQGQQLRDLVIPELIVAGDSAGVQITASTRSERLASRYARDLGATATIEAGANGLLVVRRPPARPPFPTPPSAFGGDAG